MIKQVTFLLGFLMLQVYVVFAQADTLPDKTVFEDDSIKNCQDEIPDTNCIKIVLVGDIMGHDGQIEGAYVDSTKSYDYEPTFRYIKDYISDADIAIANLEVTLAGEPYKGYPQFSSPDALALAARDAGIDVLINANNHALDRGEKGVKRTIAILDSLKIAHTGTFLDSIQRDSTYPLIVDKNNFRIAVLNYTYGTNGLKISPPCIVNRIDTNRIHLDLEKARSENPDYIIVTIHWGIEYERDENSTQDKLADFIFKCGADAIIGSHPHVIQPIKYIDVPATDSSGVKRPVFFSMGNFVSNQRAEFKDGGISAELFLSRTDGKTQLDSIAYMPFWVYRDDSGAHSKFYVVPVEKYEAGKTDLKFNDNNLYRFNRFARETREHLEGIPESVYYTK